jgi:hypothetical protein
MDLYWSDGTHINENPQTAFLIGLCFWMLVWGLTLHLPPGARTITASYRLNFWHAVLSSLLCIGCFMRPDLVPEWITTPCSTAYFVTDFYNMIFNDFIYKVGGYQKESARKMEYFHHILCIIICFLDEFGVENFCTFNYPAPSNPTVRFMTAEFSTPFLILWRVMGEQDTYMFGAFTVAFFGCRICYQCMVLMPETINACVWQVGTFFSVPYILLQLAFLYFVTRKFYTMLRKGTKDRKDDEKSVMSPELARLSVYERLSECLLFGNKDLFAKPQKRENDANVKKNK